MKKLTAISPSQIDTFLTCRRKWWFNKIMGLPLPQHPAAALGESVHTSIEKFFETGDAAALHAIARPALTKLVELRKGAPIIETKMKRTLRNGLEYNGRIDLLDLDAGLVVDHKTSSTEQYAKTSEELAADVQMLSYAYELYCRKPQPVVTVAHNFLRTRGAGYHRYTDANIPAPAIMAGWSRIQDISDEMLKTAVLEAPATVPPTKSACSKYGGCHFQSNCKALDLAAGCAPSSPYDALSTPSAPQTYEVNTTMSTKHTASVLRSMGIDDDTIRSAVAKGTCTDDLGLTGTVAAAPAAPAGVNPPEGPGNARTVKNTSGAEIKAGTAVTAEGKPAVAEAPAGASVEQQVALLKSNGWSQDDIDLLSDDAFAKVVAKNIKRADVRELVTGTGAVQGESYDDVVVDVVVAVAVAPARRPSRSAAVEEKPVVEEKPAAVRRGAPVAEANGSTRQPRNAVPRLQKLGYPVDVIGGMDAAEMRRILDGNDGEGVPYAVEPGEPEPAPLDEQVAKVEQTTVTVTYAAAEYITATPAQDYLARIAEMEQAIAAKDARIAGLEASAALAPGRLAPAGLTLYIDCAPHGVAVRSLDEILTPYMRKVEADGYRDDKTGKHLAVPYYGLIPYNNGEKAVVGYLLNDIAKVVPSGVAVAIRVDTRSACAARALEILVPLAATVVVGGR